MLCTIAWIVLCVWMRRRKRCLGGWQVQVLTGAQKFRYLVRCQVQVLGWTGGHHARKETKLCLLRMKRTVYRLPMRGTLSNALL